MTIYVATWLLEKSQGESCTAVGKNDRLISFYHTREKAEELERYIKTGK